MLTSRVNFGTSITELTGHIVSCRSGGEGGGVVIRDVGICSLYCQELDVM